MVYTPFLNVTLLTITLADIPLTFSPLKQLRNEYTVKDVAAITALNSLEFFLIVLVVVLFILFLFWFVCSTKIYKFIGTAKLFWDYF